MMLEISICSDAPHFSQEHLLFGRHYRLEFEWLERETLWAMHVYGDHDEAIALGLRVALHWPILCDRHRCIGFMLRPTTPNASLNVTSFSTDFVLVAYEII